MRIIDIFKRKKKKPEEKKEKIKEKKLEKPKEKVEERIVGKPKKRETGAAAKVLRSPHIAEKPSRLAEINQYVFKIWPGANKTEVKKAVEEVYGVDVLGVRIIKIPKKRRRVGRTLGFRAGYKKAIVKVKQGQKIEILPR